MLTGLAMLAVAGLVLAVLQLPGSWLILAAAVGYDWYYGWDRLTLKWLIALAVVAILAELFELLSGAFVAKQAGASRKAMIGAVIGGFVGMIALSIPVPIIGTIIGGMIGCFAGAVIGEMSVHSRIGDGTRVGVFAVIGRILGLFAKTTAAVIIAGVTITLAILAMFSDAVAPTQLVP